MKKLYFVLILITYALSELDQASSNDPLLVLKTYNLFLPGRVKLPYKAEELNGKIIYPEIEPEERSQDENNQDEENQDETNQDKKKKRVKDHFYLCHPSSPDSRKIIEASSKYNPQDLYCLIDYSEDEQFQETRECPSKILPLFTKNLIHNPASREECGTSTDHDLYYFGFNYCRITEYIQDVSGSPIISQVLSIYDICFDTHNTKSYWTRHQIQTGFMLKDPLGLPSQRLENESEFSTEGFKLWADKVFKDQAEEYAKQEPNAPDKMIPQQFVPHEDIALNVWKRTSMHIVNTAPLWEQLVPLMKSINDGIRKAAIKVNLDTYNPPNSYDNLDIYTTTYSHLSWGQRFFNWLKFFEKDSFGWSIWCKFVHYESENKGIMIFVHNLPGNPPEKTKPAIDNSQGDQGKQTESDGDSNKPGQSSKKNETTDVEMKKLLREKECTKTVTCNFESWFVEQPEQSYRHDLFSYAYCCEVDKKKIDQLFGIRLKKDITLLDINNMIVKNPPTDND